MKACSSIYKPEMCLNVWNNIALGEIRNAIKVIDPIIMCTRMHICSSPQIVHSLKKDYIARIEKDSPPRKASNRTSDLSNTFKFLLFTDPHVEYEYEEGRNGTCGEASCCTKNLEMATKKEHKAGKFGYLGKCDLPPITLEDFVKTALEKFKPDAFMWLGDNPSHQIWNQSRKNHMRGISHITKMIMEHPAQEYTKVGKMYPILGNHEGLPCDNFNLEGESHKWILNETANLWKPWFSESSYNDYFMTGSYSQLHPGTKLRIIGLNDLVHDTMNSFLWKNATNPLGTVFCFANI